MENQNEIVITLRNKINTVISLYEKQKNEYSEIAKEKEFLNEEIDAQKKEIEKLNDKYNILRLTKSISTSSDNSHDAKIKINSIVREIDKCIALLNR